MSNGLTKLAVPVAVPGVPGVAGSTATPQRTVLTPSPPGYYYVWDSGDQDYRLVKSTTARPPTSTRTYTIDKEDPFHVFASFKQGDTVRYGFAPRYYAQPEVFQTGVVPAPPNSFLPDPPANMVLVQVQVTSPTVMTPETLYALPAGVTPVQFDMPCYWNGYPTSRVVGEVLGWVGVPDAVGNPVKRTIKYRRDAEGRLTMTQPPDAPGRITFRTRPPYTITILPTDGWPAIPPTPGYTDYKGDGGWNAGANSIATVDGDLYTKFQVPFALGAKVGLFPDGPREVTAEMPFAFHVFANLNGRGWSIVDNGRNILLPNSIAVDDTTYEIRRVDEQVSFYVDDALVYVSKNPSTGPLRVGSTLYQTGDIVL